MKGQNLVPIPGELNSVAVGGVVAAAESIYDYSKSKNQEDINDELSDGMSDLGDRVGTLEENAETATTTIMTRVNSAISENEQNVADMISRNQNNVNTRLLENETAMNDLNTRMSTVLADNQTTRDAIDALDVDTQGALALSTQVQNQGDDIEDLQDQIGDIKIRIVTQSQYDTLVALSNLDMNTLYFVKE